MIKIINLLTIYIIKILIIIMEKIFNRGTSLPGKTALKINPKILQLFSEKYDIVLVTGTNGKTTTTSMVCDIIKECNKEVVTNSSGANMLSGIVTTLINSYKIKKEKQIAIIEVDEANLKLITKHIEPKIICITNLFKDQLDRYGEVYNTLNIILEGINTRNTLLILNGDDPILGNITLENEKKYFGFGIKNNIGTKVNVEGKFCIKCRTEYNYEFVSYNHLGEYHCMKCGYKRPDLDYRVNKILELGENFSRIEINSNDINLNVGGTYNIYNALCAYSICEELEIEKKIIISSLEKNGDIFGRQESIKIKNKEIKIILVKNPAGYNEALELIKFNQGASLAFLLNDDYADGRDVSWIWDVEFEKIKNISKNIYIGGSRKYDMGVRLKIAKLNKEKFIFINSNKELVDKIIENEENINYVLSTYTAMTSLRKYLFNNNYISKHW